MLLFSLLNPRRPFIWLATLVTGGAIAITATTYSAFFGPATTILEEYTVPVEAERLQLKVDASGTIVARRSVNISPKVAGRLQRLLVDQGSVVKQGQPLAVMENTTIQAQGNQALAQQQQALSEGQAAEQRINQEIRQAQARVVAAEARLEEARLRIPTEIAELEVEIAAAQAELSQARARVGRYTIALEQAAISGNEMEDALIEQTNAEAAVRDAEARLVRVDRTARPEIIALEAELQEARLVLAEREQTARPELDRLGAAIAETQARVEELRITGQDSLITAPFDGVITQRYATEGAFVTPTTSGSSNNASAATSILAIAEEMEILAKIPEIDIILVQPGQLVDVVADAFPGQTFRGQVRLVAPEAIVEENVTSFEVRMIIDPQAREKLPLQWGMNVDVTFLGPELAQTLVVPTVAIVTEEGETGVMVPDLENKPEFRPVALGATIDDQTQVVRGLQPGDRVFIDIPEQFRDRDDDN